MSHGNELGPARGGADRNLVGEQVPRQYIAGLRRRRNATYRLPPLDCGCVDPWSCGSSRNLREGHAASYSAAAEHLLNLGLTPAPNIPAMRELWQRSGDDRRLVQTIAERWEVVV